MSTQNSPNNTSFKHINYEDYSKLKKKFKTQQSEWLKEKAILEQKLELFQMQISEAKQREENLKKMNENIMGMFNDITSDNKTFVHTFEKHTSEILEQKSKNTEFFTKLEMDCKVQKDKINDYEIILKEKNLQFEKEKLNFNSKISEKEKEINKLKEKNQKFEEELKRYSLNNNSENENKINELNKLIDKQKIENDKEIQRLYENYNNNLDEIKKIYEDYQEEIRSSRNCKELEELKLGLEETENKMHEEIEYMQKEKKQNMKTIEKMKEKSNQLEQEKKTLADEIQKQKEKFEAKQNEFKTFYEEHKKCKKIISELSSKLSEKEEIEQALQNLLYKSSKNKNISQIHKTDRVISQRTREKKTSKSRFSQGSFYGSLTINNKDGTIDFYESPNKDEMEGIYCENEKKNEKENEKKYFKFDNKDDPSISMDIPNNLINSEEKNFKNYINNSDEDDEEENFDKNDQIEKEQFAKLDSDNNINDEDVSKEISKKFKKKKESSSSNENANNTNIYAKKLNFDDDNSQVIFNNGEEDEDYEINHTYENISQIPLSKDNTSNNGIKTSKRKETNPNMNKSENMPLSYNDFMNKIDKGKVKVKGVPLSQIKINIDENDKILKTTKSTNNSALLQCELCKESFTPEVFLKHIHFCHPDNAVTHKAQMSNNVLSDLEKNLDSKDDSVLLNDSNIKTNKNSKSGFVSKRSEPAGKKQPVVCNQKLKVKESFFENTENDEDCDNSMSVNPELAKIVDDLQYEKRLIVEKLKDVEGRLRQTENKNENLEDEKEKIILDFERIMTELHHTKMEMAMTEEKKEECEMALKNEIKFLINKLLKAKGKLAEQKQNLSISNMSILNNLQSKSFYKENTNTNQSFQKTYHRANSNIPYNTGSKNKSKNNNNNNNNILNEKSQNLMYSRSKTPGSGRNDFLNNNKNGHFNVNNTITLDQFDNEFAQYNNFAMNSSAINSSTYQKKNGKNRK